MTVRAWDVNIVANNLINAIENHDDESAARAAAMLLGHTAETMQRLALATERLANSAEQIEQLLTIKLHNGG